MTAVRHCFPPTIKEHGGEILQENPTDIQYLKWFNPKNAVETQLLHQIELTKAQDNTISSFQLHFSNLNSSSSKVRNLAITLNIGNVSIFA